MGLREREVAGWRGPGGGGGVSSGIEFGVLHSLGGFETCSGYGSGKRHEASAGTPRWQVEGCSAHTFSGYLMGVG